MQRQRLGQVLEDPVWTSCRRQLGTLVGFKETGVSVCVRAFDQGYLSCWEESGAISTRQEAGEEGKALSDSVSCRT